MDGITICSLDDVPSGALTSFFKSIRNTLDFDFGDDIEVLTSNQRFASSLRFSVHTCILHSNKRLIKGPWQVMLKQTNGSYAYVAESATRFSLGETKEELLRVLGMQQEKGSSLEFLRKGYKNSQTLYHRVQ